MSMIQVGDRIICIRDSKNNHGYVFPVKKGEEFIVRELYICPNCQAVGYDIGLPWAKVVDGVCKCDCGRITQPSHMPKYHFSLFAKVEEQYRVVEVHSEISEQARELISITETVAQ